MSNLYPWITKNFTKVEAIKSNAPESTELFTGKSIKLDQDVVIKCLQATSDEELSRYSDQFFLLNRLSHHDILPVYEHHFDFKNKLLIYSTPKGSSLENELKNRTFSELEILQILFQVARALKYASEQIPSISHGNIKPSNIIFIDGNTKLDGFQPHTDTKQSSQSQQKANSSGKKKTANYVAPELIQTELKKLNGQIDYQKADVFTLGLVMLNVLGFKESEFAELSESNEKFFEMTKNILTVKSKRIRGGFFTALLTKMITRTPETRISLSELIQELERMIAYQLKLTKKIDEDTGASVDFFLRWKDRIDSLKRKINQANFLLILTLMLFLTANALVFVQLADISYTLATQSIVITTNQLPPVEFPQQIYKNQSHKDEKEDTYMKELLVRVENIESEIRNSTKSDPKTSYYFDTIISKITKLSEEVAKIKARESLTVESLPPTVLNVKDDGSNATLLELQQIRSSIENFRQQLTALARMNHTLSLQFDELSKSIEEYGDKIRNSQKLLKQGHDNTLDLVESMVSIKQLLVENFAKLNTKVPEADSTTSFFQTLHNLLTKKPSSASLNTTIEEIALLPTLQEQCWNTLIETKRISWSCTKLLLGRLAGYILLLFCAVKGFHEMLDVVRLVGQESQKAVVLIVFLILVFFTLQCGYHYHHGHSLGISGESVSLFVESALMCFVLLLIDEHLPFCGKVMAMLVYLILCANIYFGVFGNFFWTAYAYIVLIANCVFVADAVMISYTQWQSDKSKNRKATLFTHSFLVFLFCIALRYYANSQELTNNYILSFGVTASSHVIFLAIQATKKTSH